MAEDQNINSGPLVGEGEENKDPYRIYMDMIERLDSFFVLIGGKIPPEISVVDSICNEVMQSVGEQRESFIGFILGGGVEGHKIAKSSINTAILSTCIAQCLDIPYHKTLHIITGALLHDVGMLRLPAEIIEKRGGLSDEERQKMENHPLAAYNIVTKELSMSTEIGNIVLQHHERWDGKGYPRRTGGEAIEIGARIVSVADAFEAMVSHKSYRNPIMGYEAMKNLLADNSNRFDPAVLKAFLKTMGLYPIGSTVQLNNGTLARIIEVHGEAPMRPKVQVLTDGKTIDLMTEKGLFISKAVDAKEAAPKNA